ncbi:hypothetical protein [Variovorax ginsengisoli]|uniref:Uncharacterized protein n=1 Tax=Variovorax ginsengisoli TaxID=363844 RepID=A0ABT8SAK1_9BURK|nr:hypothetical protein [Variovorax ginsengisoli]MDN8615857.1 hypothetical protein [Variovorax ginsengisoli]MDO1535027.1 hypothetical protein [Variovorax ginsengisoli]
MPPIPTDPLQPRRSARTRLADFAISVAVVAAISLITGFFAATSATS